MVESYSIVYREAKAMCLSWAMIGVLADDDYFYFIERAKVESIEYEFARRIYGAVLIFGSYEIGQGFEVIFVEFGL